ncbi:MAG: 50S ribosomal protein L18e [Candidatus ainarchaeum sp.]|nr:50S ribosomal protein L18e [Candidatus ainarchaeum sp.]MDD3975777.1 50S ribosomal protein L18e [Candidatus ainarchaeum sp.]
MTIKKSLKNNEKVEMIDKLYKAYKQNNKDIYKRVAKLLEKSVRKNISVNLSKLEKLNVVKDGSIVVVPGKILGAGEVSKKITVYAYKYSDSVKNKIHSIKSFDDFCKDKIDYKNTLIII